MVELLRISSRNGFTTYIASGGDRDFMRPITERSTACRPSASSAAPSRSLQGRRGRTLAYIAKPDVFDDGPVKPVRIWSRIGRRPILAVGNSNGDIPMLQFAGGHDRPALRLLVLHDDRARIRLRRRRRAVARAREGEGWTVVSMKNDWKRVFD